MLLLNSWIDLIVHPLIQIGMTRFFTGLASGLAIAYLTAPRPGKQLRHTLVESTRQTIEKGKQIKNQWDKTVAQVKTLLRVVRVYDRPVGNRRNE